jgi:hypothetical protein
MTTVELMYAKLAIETQGKGKGINHCSTLATNTEGERKKTPIDLRRPAPEEAMRLRRSGRTGQFRKSEEGLGGHEVCLKPQAPATGGETLKSVFGGGEPLGGDSLASSVQICRPGGRSVLANPSLVIPDQPAFESQ